MKQTSLICSFGQHGRMTKIHNLQSNPKNVVHKNGVPSQVSKNHQQNVCNLTLDMWVTDPICLGELINWKPTSFTNEREERKNTYSSGILQMELSCCHLFETTRITRKTKQTYKLNSTHLSMMLTQVSLHLERWCNGITGTQKRKVFS